MQVVESEVATACCHNMADSKPSPTQVSSIRTVVKYAIPTSQNSLSRGICQDSCLVKASSLESSLSTTISPCLHFKVCQLNFSLDKDILEKTGDEVATLGEQLEHVFGWQLRTTGDGVIPIVEHGPAICALHPILEEYSAKYPNNNVLKKWIVDIAIGAEKAFKIYDVLVRFIYIWNMFEADNPDPLDSQ
jgi:hypothetical protein